MESIIQLKNISRTAKPARSKSSNNVIRMNGIEIIACIMNINTAKECRTTKTMIPAGTLVISLGYGRT